MLPTIKTPPRTSLSDLTILFYAPSKFGKTTWCAQAQDALFLATEAGLNALEVYQVPILSWEDFLMTCAEISEGKHSFKTIIIDTIDIAYKLCCDYICKKFKIEHESDLGYGKGYALVANEFLRVLNKLAFLPQGLIMTSHVQEKEIDTRTGKHVRLVPSIPDKVRKLVTAMCDLILFGDFELHTGDDNKPTWQRVIRTKPTAVFDAGDRTGKLPEVLPLEYSAFLQALEHASVKKQLDSQKVAA